MCNLYTYKMTAEDMRLLKQHYSLVGLDYLEVLGLKNDATAVYPNYEAPVISARLGQLMIEPIRWGFPPPPFVSSKAPVTNVRNVSKGFWKPYLGKENRCLVPANAFSEWNAALKRPSWFKLPEGTMFYFAGIWRTWTGDRGTKAKPNVGDHVLFSFLTTEPNAVVASIHPKAMPVLLRNKAATDQWLNGSDADALELQKPAPDDAIVLVE
jgi:putative SOS response-associated peptidase YedK